MISALLLLVTVMMLSGCLFPYWDDGGGPPGGGPRGGGHRGGGYGEGGHREGGERH